jgi:Mor family transcriptional regulator
LEENDVFEELQGIIGTEAAKRLVDHYSGSSLYIPKRICIKLRHKKIKEEFGQGAGYKELALRYGLTERYVRRIVHKRRPKGLQDKT